MTCNVSFQINAFIFVYEILIELVVNLICLAVQMHCLTPVTSGPSFQFTLLYKLYIAQSNIWQNINGNFIYDWKIALFCNHLQSCKSCTNLKKSYCELDIKNCL